MGVAIAAIGVKVGYKSGTSADTISTVSWGTGGFTAIPDIKSTPDFNPQPNTADATTFDNKEFTTAVELLKDIGGSLSFSANLTSALETAWNNAIDACTTGSGQSAVDNGGVWWAIDIPGIDKSIVFFGKPSSLGLPSLTANSLAETTVYITPITEPKWVTDATTV